jgi:RNA polymerase sigma-70 factor (sigma-E family)
MQTHQAFEEFMRQRQRPLLRFAMVLTGDAQRSEDIVADVLGRAWEKWERIGALAEPNAYVRRMVVNEFLSWKRLTKRTTPRNDVAQLIDDADRDDASSTESVLTERSAMVDALTRLPRKQRAALVLRYYEGLSDAEIAAVLGCGPGTVRSNTSRALAALRIHLHDPQTRGAQPRGPQPHDRPGPHVLLAIEEL